MQDESLIHDAAHAISVALLELYENVIRPEEKADAFTETFRIVRAGIEAHHAQVERRHQRLYGRIKNPKNQEN